MVRPYAGDARRAAILFTSQGATVWGNGGGGFVLHPATEAAVCWKRCWVGHRDVILYAHYVVTPVRRCADLMPETLDGLREALTIFITRLVEKCDIMLMPTVDAARKRRISQRWSDG
ncbi:hypothetical protein DJICPGNB_18250 [Escherichia coli]|nr:hypothetical protein DJICPGNB_18250 [Escherichia coli]